MPYFLVSLMHGPRWDDTVPRRHQAGWDEHAAFMDDLVARGVVLLGGPVGEDPDAGDALLLVQAPDAGAAARVVDADPWHDGVLATRGVQEWTVWLGTPPGSRAATQDPGQE